MKKVTKENNSSEKLSWLSDFNKDCSKMEGIAMSSPAPKHWLSFGNYVINRTLSGHYMRGVGTGRMAAAAGPSNSGKSFLGASLIKAALTNKDQEWGVLAIDSENALDDDYLEKMHANALNNPNYIYRGVNSISDTTNIVSKFIRGYKKSNEQMPFLIVLDSIDQLRTDSEVEQYEKGEIKGDQGQHAKQIKKMLGTFMNDIKGTNIAFFCVKQVYAEQDRIAAMRNPWRITESFRFPFSQIGLITKLLLKNDDTKKFEGITLKVYGEKTRYTKPYQQSRVEVPYDTGMDPYSGLLEAAITLGVVIKPEGKQLHTFGDITFKEKEFDQYKEQILQKMIESDTGKSLNISMDAYEEDGNIETYAESQTRRKLNRDGEAEEEA